MCLDFPSVRQSSRFIRKNIVPLWPNCCYCGKKLTPSMTVDHLIPKSKANLSLGILPDGINSLFNLCPCCRKCNIQRGNNPLSQWVFNINPEAIEHYHNLLQAIRGKVIGGVDYFNGVRQTTMHLLRMERELPHAPKVKIEEELKRLERMV